MRRLLLLLFVLAAFAGLFLYLSQTPAPPETERTGAYQHDRYGTRPAEHLRTFAAFVSSFDGDDDDSGDGRPDTLGIPQWVSYELRRNTGPLSSSQRPSRWTTDAALAAAGLAPEDETYQYSKAFRQQNPNWFVRGHLAMKYHAERLGAEAARQTHTLLNAVPQRTRFNGGIWLDLECRTGAWANEYGAVWIVTGPVFFAGGPRTWIGEPEKGERRAAAPEALFKVVIRPSGDAGRPEVLGFVYAQEDEAHGKPPYAHEPYLVSLDRIEALTGLDFLTVLDEGVQQEVESVRPEGLWPARAEFFDEGCGRSQRYAEDR